MTQHLSPRRGLNIRGAAMAEVGALEPLQLEGEEGINQLFEYRLILNSRDPDIDLGGLVGRELTCGLELDSPEPAEREISGLITQARYLGEAERHSRVELTLRPWLHLATLTTDCKVFQDHSPVEIIEAVLADYPFAADKRLIERYPRRDYTVQYNESDFEFLSRLMQEWGIIKTTNAYGWAETFEDITGVEEHRQKHMVFCVFNLPSAVCGIRSVAYMADGPKGDLTHRALKIIQSIELLPDEPATDPEDHPAEKPPTEPAPCTEQGAEPRRNTK